MNLYFFYGLFIKFSRQDEAETFNSNFNDIVSHDAQHPSFCSHHYSGTHNYFICWFNINCFDLNIVVLSQELFDCNDFLFLYNCWLFIPVNKIEYPINISYFWPKGIFNMNKYITFEQWLFHSFDAIAPLPSDLVQRTVRLKPKLSKCPMYLLFPSRLCVNSKPVFLRSSHIYCFKASPPRSHAPACNRALIHVHNLWFPFLKQIKKGNKYKFYQSVQAQPNPNSKEYHVSAFPPCWPFPRLYGKPAEPFWQAKDN